MSADSPRLLGLLHTVPALAGTFGELLAERAPDAGLLHVVDAGLLDTAVRSGVTDDVTARVAGHVRHLAECGADAVLVTCSSIGEAAAAAATGVDVPVLRVDAAMAREAAALATAPGASGRIAVLATLEATLGPTGRLVAAALGGAGGETLGGAGGETPGETPGGASRDTADRVEVVAHVVAGAAAARASGDPATHDRLVADAVGRAADGADVVVLAQASMAPAAADAAVAVPVLTSPASGADALVAAVAR